MGLIDYGIYRIQCRLGAPTSGDFCLHVPGANREPGVGITQWSYSGRFVEFTDHFEFMLLADGQSRDTFYIVNRRSGLCLRLPPRGDPAKPSQQGPRPPDLIQDDYRPENDKEYRFILEPVDPVTLRPADPDTTASYRLVAASTGHLLFIEGTSGKNGQPVRAGAEAAIPSVDRRPHVFDLVAVATDGVAPPDDLGRPAVMARKLPRLAGLDEELPDSLPEREQATVLERAYIPFFAVNDPVLVRYRQVELSPYYKLERWLRWDKVRDRLFDGQTSRLTTEVTTVGMTQFDASTIRDTFNWSVEASVSASFKGVAWSGSAKLSTKINKEVEKTTQHSTESRVDRSITEEVSYPDLGHPYRVVTWVPADVFDLRAKDDRIVYSWSIRREREEAVDCFPPAAAAQRPSVPHRGRSDQPRRTVKPRG